MEGAAHDPSPVSPPAVNTDPAPVPFALNIVELTQAEYIELKWKGNYWQRQHGRLKKHNAQLHQALEFAHAKVRDLEQRLYGKKSEKSTTKTDQPSPEERGGGSRPRGQQKGRPGHGRTARPELPVVEEARDVAPEDKKCSMCGKAYALLAKTEDSRITEVQVKAHVRLVRRAMYAQGCECEGVPGLITAPPAPRLIAKSGVGSRFGPKC